MRPRTIFLLAVTVLLAGCVDNPNRPVFDDGVVEGGDGENGTVEPPCDTVYYPDDWDGDRIPNEEENRTGTDPCSPDTDGDGWDDWNETYTDGTDPANNDTDNDTLPDSTDPDPLSNTSDVDGDGYLDQDDHWPWGDMVVNFSVNWTWMSGMGRDIHAHVFINGIIVDGIPVTEANTTRERVTVYGSDWDWPDNKTTLVINFTLYNPHPEAEHWEFNYTLQPEEHFHCDPYYGGLMYNLMADYPSYEPMQ